MYIEYYFIENFIINYIIIRCTLLLIRLDSSKTRKLLGSLIGALYSLLYLDTSLNMLYTPIFKSIFILLITCIIARYSSIREYIRSTIIFCIVNIFLSGSTFFVIYFTGINHFKMSFIILCVYISCILLRYIYYEIKNIEYMNKTSVEIEIKLLDNICSCSALVDSGNLLKDPMSNMDVIIVNNDVVKKIMDTEGVLDSRYISYSDLDFITDKLDERLASRVRLIPYKHAGNSDLKMILGIKIDSLKVDNKYIENIVMGISDFKEDKYSAIINPMILN